MPDRVERCPHCGDELVPIVYGLPGAQLLDAARRGEVALGGCLVGDRNPRWSCAKCGPTEPADDPGRPADPPPADPGP